MACVIRFLMLLVLHVFNEFYQQLILNNNQFAQLKGLCLAATL